MRIMDGKPYIEQVRNCIIEYTTALGRDLTFQGIDDELSDPADYIIHQVALSFKQFGSALSLGYLLYHQEHLFSACSLMSDR